MSDPASESTSASARHGVRRPDAPETPSLGLVSALRGRWEARVEWWRNTRALSRRAPIDDVFAQNLSVPATPTASRAGLVTALIAIGAALLAVGSLWAWQTWSQRASEPIDDLLPVLVTSAGGPLDLQATDLAPPVEVPAGPVDRVLPTVTSTNSPVLIIVHVSGAVTRPGIVQLIDGSRVFDAVDLAGGASADADLERVNLAAPLVDGERVHVPRAGEEHTPTIVQPDRPRGDQSAQPDPASGALLVDINAATGSELQQLPGVGPSIAAAIVQTRADRGPFFTVDELLEVPGIGQAKLTLMRPNVVVVEP